MTIFTTIQDSGSYSPEAFVTVVNNLRLSSKGNWYAIICEDVAGKKVEIKGYQTWLQIFRVDGVQMDTRMDISVKEFKETLLRGFQRCEHK